MEIKVKLNGKNVIGNVEADTVLLDWLREKGCLSVKRGCDTSNCGLCTVFMDNKPYFIMFKACCAGRWS